MLKFIKETAGTNQILVTLFLFLCCFFFLFLFVVLVFYKESLMFFFSSKKIACVFFSCYTSKCAMHVIAFNALLRVFFSYLSLCLFSFDTHAVVVLWILMMMMMPMLPTAAASAFISFVVVSHPIHPICRNSFNYLDFIQINAFFSLLSFLIVFRSQKTHHKITVAQYRT